jgi:hypothetical protein
MRILAQVRERTGAASAPGNHQGISGLGRAACAATECVGGWADLFCGLRAGLGEQEHPNSLAEPLFAAGPTGCPELLARGAQLLGRPASSGSLGCVLLDEPQHDNGLGKRG